MDRARVDALRPAEHFTGRSLLGLLAVVGFGSGFGLLLMLVRFEWGPLYRIDHGVAGWLNGIVSANERMVAILAGVTDIGAAPITLWLVGVAIAATLIRGQRRLAAYLVVTGLGAAALDPALKLVVGRLRPVVDVPVASAPGNSFPSGHALGSTVAYGAVLLVFLPAVPRRMRPLAISVGAAIVALVGFTRVALGVHYVSDVLAGWLLGIAWLAVTAYAFRLWRREAGQPVPPITEGIEPEAAGDLKPAPREGRVLPRPLVGTAELLTGWVMIFGLMFVLGRWLTEHAGGTVVARFDAAISRWFAGLRTPALDEVSRWLSLVGDTRTIIGAACVFCPLAVSVLGRWRPALFVALALIGQATVFLLTSRAVGRPRPDVPQLDGSLPTSSFPSGHIAATICLYTTIAIIVMARTDRRWRWIPVAAAIVLPLAVIVARLYRGMHHPTDVLGSILLSALVISLLYWVLRPNAPSAPVSGRWRPSAPYDSRPEVDGETVSGRGGVALAERR